MSEQEIASEIKALSSHYPRRARSPQDELRWLTDWGTDLAAYPIADVRLVCAMWRAGTANRMPTPGELIEKCRLLVKPDLVRLAAPKAQDEPKYISPEEREQVKRMMADFLAEMKSRKRLTIGDLAKKPGETDVDQARRLWPSRERRPRVELDDEMAF